LAEIPATKKSGRISAAKAENPTVPNQLSADSLCQLQKSASALKFKLDEPILLLTNPYFHL